MAFRKLSYKGKKFLRKTCMLYINKSNYSSTFIYRVIVNIQTGLQIALLIWAEVILNNYNENKMNNKLTKIDLDNFLHSLYQLKSVLNH